MKQGPVIVAAFKNANATLRTNLLAALPVISNPAPAHRVVLAILLFDDSGTICKELNKVRNKC